MYKKITSLILLLTVVVFSGFASAEIKTIEGKGEHYMELETETLDEAKEKAKLFAELAALEEVKLTILAYSEGYNVDLTHDEVVSITEGIIYVADTKYKLFQENDGLLLMESIVTIEINTDKILDFIEREINRRKD